MTAAIACVCVGALTPAASAAKPTVEVTQGSGPAQGPEVATLFGPLSSVNRGTGTVTPDFAGDACEVKAFGPYGRSSQGETEGWITNKCVPPVTYMDVGGCLNLDESNKWVSVDCTNKYQYSSGSITTYVKHPCHGSQYWYVSGQGYAELEGVLYGAENNSKAAFTSCP
jgi:hypothetical protein